MSKGETRTPTLTPKLARRLLRQKHFQGTTRRFLELCAKAERG